MPSRRPLRDVLPPLILGTATFNTQYHPDPSSMPYLPIVRRALLEHNITAFDTSPYYGPSELLLGDALSRLAAPRESYFLVTKAGRVASSDFDYSPSWVRYSVCRSLERLRTKYLDMVYAHDAEFVSPAEVVAAVRELRRLRDEEGVVRYVGISGYPVEVLVSLAELILRETGEPVDAVLSYANFTVQNDLLGREECLSRFRGAGVGCVLNASMLGMGLLTTRGVDRGPMASWHPAPAGLRKVCSDLAVMAEADGERLEEVSIRWSLENWARAGAEFGTRVPAGGPGSQPASSTSETASPSSQTQIGASVMGVSTVEELDETWNVWRGVMGVQLEDGEAAEKERSKRETVRRLVEEVMRPSLGEWKDHAWPSGGETFVNERQTMGVIPADDGVAERWGIPISAAAAG